VAVFTIFCLAEILQHPGRLIENIRQFGELLLGALAVAGINGFVDPGNDHGGISGINPGSVDGMVIPGAIGQPAGQQEGALGRYQ